MAVSNTCIGCGEKFYGDHRRDCPTGKERAQVLLNDQRFRMLLARDEGLAELADRLLAEARRRG